MITVSEDGTVDGLNHVFEIDGDLFDQFNQKTTGLCCISEEIMESSLFCTFYVPASAGQIQSSSRSRSCKITINGKGASEIASLLFVIHADNARPHTI
jgi:hypothetical protein